MIFHLLAGSLMSSVSPDNPPGSSELTSPPVPACDCHSCQPIGVQQPVQRGRTTRKNLGKLLGELNGLGSSRNLESVKRVHERAVESGDDTNIYVASRLVDLYGKCGRMDEAGRVFDRIRRGRDVVLWNSLILGYAENGDGETGLEMFARMGLWLANARTFVAVLKACSALACKEELTVFDQNMVRAGSLQRVMALHSQAVKSRCDSDVFVVCSLVDLYSKCGSLEDAHRVLDRSRFQNVACWNAMVLGYVENGEFERALQMVSCMQSQGWKPNARTYVPAVKACAGLAGREVGDSKLVKLKSLEKGMALHCQAAQDGCDRDVFVANVLVDMYAKCGSLVDAFRVFEGMSVRSVVSWNTLLLGCIENGESSSTLKLFARMISSQDCSPDSVSYAAALKACANLTDHEVGTFVHACVCKAGMEMEPTVSSSLVDFHGKCGYVISARQVFDANVPSNMDVVAWSSLMSGYGRQGNMSVVWELFHAMREEGLQADSLMLRAVLSAFSHAGLVDEGKKCLLEMHSKYGVRPEIEHYNCVVDLLGRADRVEEALEVVQTMGLRANAMTWTTLLGACCKWKNLEMGRVAFGELTRLDEKQAAGYVLMANSLEHGAP